MSHQCLTGGQTEVSIRKYCINLPTCKFIPLCSLSLLPCCRSLLLVMSVSREKDASSPLPSTVLECQSRLVCLCVTHVMIHSLSLWSFNRCVQTSCPVRCQSLATLPSLPRVHWYQHWGGGRWPCWPHQADEKGQEQGGSKRRRGHVSVDHHEGARSGGWGD